MQTSVTKSTGYKVLDIRECVGDTTKPIILICEEHNKVVRRRIEVWECDRNAYKMAMILAPGDIINVIENYKLNKHGCHIIDDIEC